LGLRTGKPPGGRSVARSPTEKPTADHMRSSAADGHQAALRREANRTVVRDPLLVLDRLDHDNPVHAMIAGFGRS
jgi:hypothetical protein